MADTRTIHPAEAPPPSPEGIGIARKAGYQLAALSAKSCLTLWRSPLWSLAYVVVPLLTVLALGSASDAINATSTPPEGGVLLELQRCKPLNVYGRVDESAKHPCSTVGYAGDAVADAVMGRLARANGFSVGSGVGSHDVASFSSPEVLALALLKHPGRIEAGVVFTNASLSSNVYEYELWVNSTSLSAYANLRVDEVGGYFQLAGRTLALQQAVDGAIVAEAAGLAADSAGDLKLAVDSLPQKLGSSFLVMLGVPSIVPWMGSTFFSIGHVTQSLMVIALLVGEKESGVIYTIRRMGLIEATHWVSWLLVLAVPNLASALLVAWIAPVTGIALFTHTDASVLVVVWWLTSCAYTALAAALASVTNARWLDSVSALVVLFVVGFTFVVSTFDTYMPSVGSWQSEQFPTFPPAGRAVYFIFPCFHFGRIIDLILERTKTAGDDNAEEYGWGRLENPGERVAWDTSNPSDPQYFKPEGVGHSLWMVTTAPTSAAAACVSPRRHFLNRAHPCLLARPRVRCVYGSSVVRRPALQRRGGHLSAPLVSGDPRLLGPPDEQDGRLRG